MRTRGAERERKNNSTNSISENKTLPAHTDTQTRNKTLYMRLLYIINDCMSIAHLAVSMWNPFKFHTHTCMSMWKFSLFSFCYLIVCSMCYCVLAISSATAWCSRYTICTKKGKFSFWGQNHTHRHTCECECIHIRVLCTLCMESGLLLHTISTYIAIGSIFFSSCYHSVAISFSRFLSFEQFALSFHSYVRTWTCMHACIHWLSSSYRRSSSSNTIIHTIHANGVTFHYSIALSHFILRNSTHGILHIIDKQMQRTWNWKTEKSKQHRS